MMRGSALINRDSLRNLERLILLVGLIVLITSVVLLLGSGLTHFQHLESVSKKELTKSEVQTLTETINKSKRVKFSSSPTKELNIVQASMDQLAQKHNCQLQEVTSTNDTIPLLTRYKKGPDDRGWKQLAMTSHVVGSLKNVMAFTRALAMISIPIELASVEILPISGDRDSKVSAKVTFQILKQEVTR